MVDFSFVDEAVHRDTQHRGDAVDLTAAEIYEAEEPGRVDFGGGELEPAELDALDTVKRDSGDDYGWWNLEGGSYLLEYNESLDGSQVVRLETRPELLNRGASHPSLRCPLSRFCRCRWLKEAYGSRRTPASPPSDCRTDVMP